MAEGLVVAKLDLRLGQRLGYMSVLTRSAQLSVVK